MLGKSFFVLFCLSLFFTGITGGNGEITPLVLAGCSSAIRYTLSLCGMMALWNGVLEVLRHVRIPEKLSRLLSPLFSHIFPTAWRTGVGRDAITCTLCANLMGLSNAATPYALSAMEEMDRENPQPERASDDMATLAVLGCACPSLLPTTILALRYAAGSTSPGRILVPVWIVSGICLLASVLLSRACAGIAETTRRKGTRD